MEGVGYAGGKKWGCKGKWDGVGLCINMGDGRWACLTWVLKMRRTRY